MRICCLHRLSRLLKNTVPKGDITWAVLYRYFLLQVKSYHCNCVWKNMLSPEEDPRAHHRKEWAAGVWPVPLALTSWSSSLFSSVGIVFLPGMTSAHDIFWEDRDCSTTKRQIKNKQKPAAAGEEPLRRMRQEQLSDQAAVASGSIRLKGAMSAASRICHHRWWNTSVTRSLDFNKSMKKAWRHNKQESEQLGRWLPRNTAWELTNNKDLPVIKKQREKKLLSSHNLPLQIHQVLVLL